MTTLTGIQIGVIASVVTIILIGAAKQFGIIDADFASTAVNTLLAGGGGILAGRASVRPTG